MGQEFIQDIINLGKRTAQMHMALARDQGQMSFYSCSVFNPDYSVWLKNKVSYLFDLHWYVRKTYLSCATR